MGKQICNTCGTEKPFSSYHKRADSKNGVRAICKECHSKRKKERYREQSPLERQLRVLATGILNRVNGGVGKKYYYDRGIESRIGKNTQEVMSYLKENFSEDIQSMLDRGEKPSIDRINSAGHYEDGNLRIMEFRENALRGAASGGKTSQKLYGHAMIIEDLKTEEITKTPSIKAAARAIGCSPQAVSKHLKCNSPAPIFGRYVVTKEELS